MNQAGKLIITFDLESDYGGFSLSQVKNKLEIFMRSLNNRKIIPLVFIETKLLENQKIADYLVSLSEIGNIIPALHCYDHLEYTDNKNSIDRSYNLFCLTFKIKPKAYRANTYRVTKEIIHALSEKEKDSMEIEADIRKKLVSESLTFTCSLNKTCYIYNF